ncbi:hypothetical protein [Sanguibacteroides justesenii]|uniref:hypothetical protein n=1 Tax=Sanguibacteroides justesenii TaxID=1547597 RepID=UPI0006975366|nr:hypothetical protein [Sanguibacteroides justesenii]
MMEKTVYFLGSGFSKEAGGLVQNEIIRTILDEKFTGDNKKLIRARDHFIDFLKEELHIYEDHYCNVALEDVFTPIDRCIWDGLSIGRYSARGLVELREEFHALMAAAVNYSFKKNRSCGDYVDQFAEYIDGMAKKRMEDGEDRVALITTNWDVLFDHALKRAIDNGHPEKLSVVDYCCYVSSWEANDDTVKPGLLAIGYGGYNIKYLKLHGSMNWFHCPMCQRMYVRFGEEIEMMEAAYCRHCRKNYGMGEISSIKLRSNLLLPTYLKNLSNIQIKLVWQNAAIELSEATRIVFIGYSLPSADFEIRQLLARMIRPDAKIEVVIYPYGNRVKAEVDRYKNFFGSRIAGRDIILKSVPDYVTGLRNEMK